MEHIVVDDGADKKSVCQWEEDVFNASGILALFGEALVVDITEHSIERPKNKQRD
jgi:hypothetical protein